MKKMVSNVDQLHFNGPLVLSSFGARVLRSQILETKWILHLAWCRIVILNISGHTAETKPKGTPQAKTMESLYRYCKRTSAE